MKSETRNPLLIFSFLFILVNANAQVKLSSGMLGTMEARHIGPAVMGGRITAIDAVNTDSRIMYVGTAGGGIWKSNTGGSLFKPVFDKYNQSIGAITIDQKNPEVVWAGTGESNMRNTVSIGSGLYKSTDGGDNWMKVGLDSTEHISRIAIDPSNSDVVYVSAPGPLWSDSPNRGLYKTTDGGKTWNKILYIDQRTGVSEVLIDPLQPSTLYASTWEFRRKPYSFASGGKGSGVYKSTDGGATWTKLSNGLPKENFGRVAMALAPSDPKNLFAIVEAKKTSLYLSTDGGQNWQEQGSNNNVEGRPFYFSVISVDPHDPKRVYRPAWSFSISSDGGRSFSEASFEGGWVHSDHHALWINPNNTSHMYLGTDGGVYMSLDKGNNWLFLNNIPVSMLYHVVYDDKKPYHVYAGLQDNGSWTAPSQDEGGVENGDWRNIGGGDGFWVQVDKSDPDYVYSESQGGYASRVNLKTNEYAVIQPQALPGEPKLRYNWNTPIYASPTNKKKLYMGAQYLYMTENKGITWKRISPDLTTNDPLKQKQEESGGITTDNSSAENHCTIFTIAESPLDEKMIFVGTDDGNIQLSNDGGTSWTKINPVIAGMPAQIWVSSIEPSRYDKNTIYATLDNHMYGDMNTYCVVSHDLGKTWKILNTQSLKAAYAHKIREDIVNKNLLFLGTEFGLYISIDGGENWTQYNSKIPPVAVRDIQIEPNTNDLILATHGRGILIVDDISPLRQLSPDVLAKDVFIFKTRPTPVTNGHFGGAFPSAGGYVGYNASEEPQIIYYLKDRLTTGELKIQILDNAGKEVGTAQATKRKGINKVDWSMRLKPPRTAKGVRIDGAGFFGPLCKPGTYTVRITKGKDVYEEKIELIKDPISAHSDADIALRNSTTDSLFSMSEELAFFTEQISTMKDEAQVLADSVKDKSLKNSLNAFSEKMESIRKELIATKGGLGITGEERIREKLSELYSFVVGYDGRPTDSQLDKMKAVRHDLDVQKAKATEIWKTDLTRLNASLEKSGRKKLEVMTKEQFDKDNPASGSPSMKEYRFNFPFAHFESEKEEVSERE
ncbi:MAG: glycosyl hydrolase [Bacteroidia bacterium]